MNTVSGSDAYQIGWVVGKLVQAMDYSAIQPVLENGEYTDTVMWSVAMPDGRYRAVQLTIGLVNPE